MDSHFDSLFFSSFLCSHPDCEEPNPNENTLLNCFHTVCKVHLQHDEMLNCPNRDCNLILEKDFKRCENPISFRIANQLYGLRATREKANKCQICEKENALFCTECSSAWCEEHRDSIHSRFGKSHKFVVLSGNNHEVVSDILNCLNAPKSRVNDELDSIIDLLKSRKDSMGINMVRFENLIREFQDDTIRITEEAERDFDRIKRHIELIREEKLEKLRVKSDEFLREIEEKIQDLKSRAEATDRALNIAISVQNARLKTDPNFVQLFKENNNLTLSDKLTETPARPTELINVPKIVKKISKELVRIQPFKHCSGEYNVQYSLQDEVKYCYTEPIKSKIARNEEIFIFFQLPNTSSNFREFIITITHTRPESPDDIKNPQDSHQKIHKTKKDGNFFYILFGPYQPAHTIVTKITGRIVTDADDPDGGGYTFHINVQPKKSLQQFNNQLSTLRVEPGHLAFLTKSRNKIFAVCTDANQVRKFDATPKAPDSEHQLAPPAPAVWNSETSFGVGHLIEPKGICAFESVIFVSDCFHHAVLCFTTEGSFLNKFGSYGSGKRQFQFPMGMATDQENGKLMVADHENIRIQILLLDSHLDGWEAFQANREIELKGKPVDVKVDTLGSVLVLTNLGEILKYDRFYNHQDSILYSASICPLLPFFTIDINDVIYVCSNNGCVYLITEIEEEPDKYNLRRHPTIPKNLALGGLTVDENCTLYVAHNEPSKAADPTRSLVFVS